MTIQRAREILGKEAEGMTDDQIALDNIKAGELADVIIDIFLKLKSEGRLKTVKTKKGHRFFIKSKAKPGEKEKWEELKN